jgi:hypothetical protein
MERRKDKRNDAELKAERKVLDKLGKPSYNSYFLAPVEEGYIKYTDLLNGGLTLFDIEIMNESINYNYNYNRLKGIEW